MRLPHNLIQSPFFSFSKAEELIGALGIDQADPESASILALSLRGLPPITSRHTLATMLGVNPGLIWSISRRPKRYYRYFEIRSGQKIRKITVPKVALKIIQKWLGYHFSRAFEPSPHVYGFVPGRSHIEAAHAHFGAEWAISVDISSFFQTTPEYLINKSLCKLGYEPESAKLIGSLTCLDGFLAQGSPASPALSNICFAEVDESLAKLSAVYECTLTRYADDIVMSGRGGIPGKLREELKELFAATPWRLAPEKETLQPLKGRIKIYGFIVNGNKVRTTKGYRNKLRAYEHILQTKGEKAINRKIMTGHTQYAKHVETVLNRLNHK
jgi:RNA-directed DNA polymerase